MDGSASPPAQRRSRRRRWDRDSPWSVSPEQIDTIRLTDLTGSGGRRRCSGEPEAGVADGAPGHGRGGRRTGGGRPDQPSWRLSSSQAMDSARGPRAVRPGSRRTSG